MNPGSRDRKLLDKMVNGMVEGAEAIGLKDPDTEADLERCHSKMHDEAEAEAEGGAKRSADGSATDQPKPKLAKLSISLAPKG